MEFKTLVSEIARLHEMSERSAGYTLQRILSVRNWSIGAYIVAFEQSGEDRAGYGDRVLEELAAALSASGCEGLSSRSLYNCRQVASAYPDVDISRLFLLVGLDPKSLHLWRPGGLSSASGVLSKTLQTSARSRRGRRPRSADAGMLQGQNSQTSANSEHGVARGASAESLLEYQNSQTSAKSLKPLLAGEAQGVMLRDQNSQTSAKSEDAAAGGASAESLLESQNSQTSARWVAAESAVARGTGDLPWRDQAWYQRLFFELTFSHLLELSRIESVVSRAFYELYALKERWSVRELYRQRQSMLYERVGLSENREEVLEMARQGKVDERPAAQLRDPYVFEFLGLRRSPALTEGDLEEGLLTHLQEFLLEMGREFCFVDRQYRITVGNRHRYLDLLFFHRALRCLVAVDLKLGEFQPEHEGQMRFYLNYLAQNVALEGENPPVGILLCADKHHETVQITTSGDEQVFVSRYLLELPSEETLCQWLHEQVRLNIDEIERQSDASDGKERD